MKSSHCVLSGNFADVTTANPQTRGWVLGHFMPEGSLLHDERVEVKWSHYPTGSGKAHPVVNRTARTLAILISGAQVIDLPQSQTRVELGETGDFLLWDAGVSHSYRSLAQTQMLVIRWPSVACDQVSWVEESLLPHTPAGWERGNLFTQVTEHPQTRCWLIGHFMPRKTIYFDERVEVRLGQHPEGDGKMIPGVNQVARTLSILVRGEFTVRFPEFKQEVVLNKLGDFALFDAGIAHTSEALMDSVIITVRWPSLAGDQVPVK